MEADISYRAKYYISQFMNKFTRITHAEMNDWLVHYAEDNYILVHINEYLHVLPLILQ